MLLVKISGLGPEWFPMIVNSAEEFKITLNLTLDPEQDCHNTAWIGGSTNVEPPFIFYYSSSPDSYIQDDSGM